MFAFRMFELVAAIQICIQNWKTFFMIFTRKCNKIKHQKNIHRKLSVDIESTMNSFFPTSFSSILFVKRRQPETGTDLAFNRKRGKNLGKELGKRQERRRTIMYSA